MLLILNKDLEAHNYICNKTRSLPLFHLGLNEIRTNKTDNIKKLNYQALYMPENYT